MTVLYIDKIISKSITQLEELKLKFDEQYQLIVLI